MQCARAIPVWILMMMIANKSFIFVRRSEIGCMFCIIRIPQPSVHPSAYHYHGSSKVHYIHELAQIHGSTFLLEKPLVSLPSRYWSHLRIAVRTSLYIFYSHYAPTLWIRSTKRVQSLRNSIIADCACLWCNNMRGRINVALLSNLKLPVRKKKKSCRSLTAVGS